MNDQIDPRPILDLAMAFQRSRPLLTACELDVFTVLSDEWRTAEEIAAAVDADARATDRLLNALVALGLIYKANGRFANTPLAARFLVRGRPDFMAGLQHTSNMWDRWSTLTSAVRQGGAVGQEPIADRGQDWARPFIAAMHWRGRQQAPSVVNLIGVDGVGRVLDVGGGSGIFSMAFVRAAAGINAVVFDLPAVVPLAKNYIETEGFAAQVSVEPGDYLTDPLPSGFDLVLMSAVIHSNSPEENRLLVRKAAAALNSGGRVAIVDWVMSEDRTEPAIGALFALNMLVGTSAGDTYTESEVRRWMTDAGLTDILRREAPAGTSVMVGRLEQD
ncbi:MAG: methyltransferase [Vicinamibacterales bacterium]